MREFTLHVLRARLICVVCHRLGAGHEDLLWRIRLEPALIDVFQQIWGTDELLVSLGKPISQ
jgi:hypothetical protein